MKTKLRHFSNKEGTTSTIALLYTALALLTINIIIQLHSDFLWFDEAGQFYIGIGQNHYSNIGIEKGDIFDVIINNQQFNLDPGGFSIIIYLWTKISTNLYWLRVLPVSFFLMYIVCFFNIFRVITENRINALYLTFIPFFIPPLISHAVEIRAYTMEALGTVLGLLILFSLEKKITLNKIMIFSIITSFFICSRYTLLITTSIHTLIVIKIIIYSKLETKNKLIYSILYCTPLLITVFTIYFFSTQHHMAINDSSVTTSVSYLPFIGVNPTVLLKTHNIIYLMVVLFLSTFYYYKSLLIDQNLKSLLEYTIIVNITMIMLSILNLHPWSILQSRLNPLLILTSISTIWVSTIIFKQSKLKITLKEKFVNSFIVIICFLHIFSLNTFLKDNWRNHNLISDINRLKSESNLDLSNIFIYIDNWYYVSVKYLFEYGMFADDKDFNIKYFNIINDDLEFNNIDSNNYLIISKKIHQNYKKLTGYNNIYTNEDSNIK